MHLTSWTWWSITSTQKMKKKQRRSPVKKKLRQLWARSGAHRDNASGHGSEVKNERKSCAAVQSATATRRTDLKAAQRVTVRSKGRGQRRDIQNRESCWTWTEAAEGGSLQQRRWSPQVQSAAAMFHSEKEKEVKHRGLDERTQKDLWWRWFVNNGWRKW